MDPSFFLTRTTCEHRICPGGASPLSVTCSVSLVSPITFGKNANTNHTSAVGPNFCSISPRESPISAEWTPWSSARRGSLLLLFGIMFRIIPLLSEPHPFLSPGVAWPLSVPCVPLVVWCHIKFGWEYIPITSLVRSQYTVLGWECPHLLTPHYTHQLFEKIMVQKCPVSVGPVIWLTLSPS